MIEEEPRRLLEQQRRVGTRFGQRTGEAERFAHLRRRLVARHRTVGHRFEKRRKLIDELVSERPERLGVDRQRCDAFVRLTHHRIPSKRSVSACRPPLAVLKTR